MKPNSLLKISGGVFDWPNLQARIDELAKQSEDPSLWEDADRAKRTLQEKTILEKQFNDVNNFDQQVNDAVDFYEMAEAENDADMLEDIANQILQLQEDSRKKEIESLLSDDADHNDCYIEIHAGAGGTEAQDWAEMLLRMYLRWAERREYKVEWIEDSPGEEAGLKSVTYLIKGYNAYGWMKTESGVHRLVRISPFDSNARRHTSFASIWIYPVVDESIEIEIEDKDLRIDTFRASGAGGQHVNKTDSAIRITHIPTNIVVQCQNNRSQHRNKATAMNMLKARLFELELQKQQEEQQAMSSSKTEIGWGNQIRSYVLHPYQMVKDLRTQVETGNTQAVLDGDLDKFMESALAHSVHKD